MATTLAFITTDAVADARTLRRYLGIAADRSFHCLSVDGDTSTNDTAVLLASGASGVKIGRAGSEAFAGALTHLMQDLAQQIARDGEGAQKRITVEVKGASDEASAVRIARAIANSPLVKTAIAGSDPNWGRILSAAGNSGVEFEPASVDILLQRILVCRSGVAAKFSEEELKRKLDDKECSIQFAISGGGPGQARFFTCDLTEGYIRINASYRT
jgi:glutamate N-acetyltransferase/amino-acid N-acetyltransferase